MPRHFKGAMLIGATLVILLAGLVARDMLASKDTVTFSSTTTCQPEHGCWAARANRQVQLHTSQPPDSTTPFTLSVNLQGFSAQAITLELQGVAMFMGVNRYPLVQQSTQEFSQTLRIPVCTTGPMQWRALLQIEHDNQVELAEFIFLAN